MPHALLDEYTESGIQRNIKNALYMSNIGNQHAQRGSGKDIWVGRFLERRSRTSWEAFVD